MTRFERSAVDEKLCLSHVLVDSVLGSRAYKLNTPDSDYDYRGYFCLPTRYVVGLYDVPEQVGVAGTDSQYWEVGKFLRGCLAGNPNILEVLFTKPAFKSEAVAYYSGMTLEEANKYGVLVNSLYEARHLFLSERAVASYGGFATQQNSNAKKLVGSDDAKHRNKARTHALRLLLAATHLLKYNDVLVDVSVYPNWHQVLLDVRNGCVSDEVYTTFYNLLDAEFSKLKATRTQLADKAKDEENKQKVNDLLLSFRQVRF